MLTFNMSANQHKELPNWSKNKVAKCREQKVHRPGTTRKFIGGSI